MTNFKSEEERIKKGCGKNNYYTKHKDFVPPNKFIVKCGNRYMNKLFLCKECQAQLSQLEKDKKIVEEAIDKLEIIMKEFAQRTGGCIKSEKNPDNCSCMYCVRKTMANIVTKELKQELFGGEK